MCVISVSSAVAFRRFHAVIIIFTGINVVINSFTINAVEILEK